MESISYPVPPDTPVELGADTAVSGANIPYGKVIDGRAGSTNEWHIEPDGEGIVRPVRQHYAMAGGAGLEMPLTAGSYDAGDCLSDGYGFALPPGVYSLASVKIVTANLGDIPGELPEGLVLAVTNYVAATPPTWAGDGDPFDPSLPGGVGYEAMAMEAIGNFAPLYGTQRAYVISEDAGKIIHVNPGSDSLRLIPFTTEAATFTAGDFLVIAGIIERLGNAAVGA